MWFDDEAEDVRLRLSAAGGAGAGRQAGGSILHQNFLRRNAPPPPPLPHLHPPPYVTEKANEPIDPLEKS